MVQATHPNQELRAALVLKAIERADKAVELKAANKNKANALLLKMLAQSSLASEVSAVTIGVEIYA